MKTKNFIEVLIGFVFIYSYKEEGINVYQPSVILSRKCYVNIPNRISLLIEFSDKAKYRISSNNRPLWRVQKINNAGATIRGYTVCLIHANTGNKSCLEQKRFHNK